VGLAHSINRNSARGWSLSVFSNVDNPAHLDSTDAGRSYYAEFNEKRAPQWIAKQQLARQRTKCFWREPVGQQKSDSGIERNRPLCGVPRLAPRTID
jgi:hypothetical protein